MRTISFQPIPPRQSKKIEDWLIDQNIQRGQTIVATAKAVKTARKERKLTQVELATIIGSTQASISRLESGRLSDIGVQILQRIGTALNFETRIVFEEKDQQLSGRVERV